MELLITVEFEANVCLNDVPWMTTKMKPSFRTNRRANVGGLYLESCEMFIQISIANTYNYYVVDVPLLMAFPWALSSSLTSVSVWGPSRAGRPPSPDSVAS